MNLEEIKKRAEEIKRLYFHDKCAQTVTTEAADQIIALVAEVELLQTGLGVAGEFIKRNEKLTAANKIMRDGLECVMDVDNSYYSKTWHICDKALAEADEVMK